jgi:hypothetical protein
VKSGRGRGGRKPSPGLRSKKEGVTAVAKRVFIVYREDIDCAPKAIDITMPETNDIIGGFEWYGARADTAQAAIQEFEKFEKCEQRDETIYRRRLH